MLRSSPPSPSKKAKAEEKLTVRFIVFNQETFKSGLIFLKFDQGNISDNFRAGLKQLKDKGKFITSVLQLRQVSRRRSQLHGMVRLSPPPPSSLLLYTHVRHIRRANVNWWQEQNDTLKLTLLPKTFMQLVCEFIEKSGLVHFGGAELEDRTPVTNIHNIFFCTNCWCAGQLPQA